MEFSTFYQLPCGPEQTAQQRYEETLLQIQHADILGLDVAWLAELHFFPTFSIMPSPLLVASAAAQRTQRIRIGIAVNLLPLHNPIRNAEDSATLDVLSNGRLEYGAGRGSSPLHFSGYNLPLEESRERFLEGLDIVMQAWSKESFSYEGKYYQYRDVRVVPKPIQKPHPPLRIACNSSESFQLAGERGWRLFTSPVIVPIPRLREDIATYNACFDTHNHPRRGDEIALMAPVYVSLSATEAREHPRTSILSYFHELGQMYSQRIDTLAEVYPRMREMKERLGSMTYEHMLDNFAIFGEPAYCVERIQWFKETFGAGQFICWFNTGGKIPHAKVLESMRLFAEQVMPHFA